MTLSILVDTMISAKPSEQKDTLEETLGDRLRTLTSISELSEPLNGGRIACLACAHRCRLLPGSAGNCTVRFNDQGSLRVPRGYITSLQTDPIEKKPFFHALPGSLALSLGMIGCDYHCSFCQNWVTSQALKDDVKGVSIRTISAEEIVALALDAGAKSICSTYNEPIITVEWAVEIFRLAREAGLATSFVSNGNATPEVLDYLDPWIDFFKVDLKSFSDTSYRGLGGRLEPVLETIRSLARMEKWVEIVSLLIPGFNDSDGELNDIASFIADVSVDIPWHVTAYRPEYRMEQPEPTPAATLLRATEIGRSRGLRHVYAGNMPGRVGAAENTTCPFCGMVLVERQGFTILANHLDGDRCPACSTVIAGRWNC
ncbi:AmmeMemoRadiSam system radical SAM enzyme [Gemmatimonadota bacterium]